MAQLMISSCSETDAQAVRELRAALATARADADRHRQRTDAAVYRHRSDVALIGQRLIAEADDRDFCDDFEKFVDDINTELTVQLPRREHDYTVTVSVELRISVTAATEQQARDVAEGLVEEAETRLDEFDGVTSYPPDPSDYHLECDD
jgi:hypothetical protein